MADYTAASGSIMLTECRPLLQWLPSSQINLLNFTRSGRISTGALMRLQLVQITVWVTDYHSWLRSTTGLATTQQGRLHLTELAQLLTSPAAVKIIFKLNVCAPTAWARATKPVGTWMWSVPWWHMPHEPHVHTPHSPSATTTTSTTCSRLLPTVCYCSSSAAWAAQPPTIQVSKRNGSVPTRTVAPFLTLLLH